MCVLINQINSIQIKSNNKKKQQQALVHSTVQAKQNNILQQ
jgi:hypothetical protein